MKRHLISTLATLLLAGGLSALQAQTVPSSSNATPGTPPSVEPTPSTPPTADPAAGVIISEEEAMAIRAALEKCKDAGGPEQQQGCMNQAQQEYERRKAAGPMRPPGAGSGATEPGTPR